MKKRWIIILTIVLLIAGMAASAEEGEKHTIGVGINPFGPLWGSYKIDVGIPVTGLIEVGAQVNYFSFRQMAKMWNITGSDFPDILNVGGIVRIFPSQKAAGFFIGGRIMYLNVRPPASSTDPPVNDATAGIDLGWRFKWHFAGGWGMYFQSYLGIQRWILSGGELQDTIGVFIPIWPSFGMHFGVHF
jgi:hypothetical protein